jgi:hypothetical protein
MTQALLDISASRRTRECPPEHPSATPRQPRLTRGVHARRLARLSGRALALGLLWHRLYSVSKGGRHDAS